MVDALYIDVVPPVCVAANCMPSRYNFNVPADRDTAKKCGSPSTTEELSDTIPWSPAFDQYNATFPAALASGTVPLNVIYISGAAPESAPNAIVLVARDCGFAKTAIVKSPVPAPFDVTQRLAPNAAPTPSAVGYERPRPKEAVFISSGYVALRTGVLFVTESTHGRIILTASVQS